MIQVILILLLLLPSIGWPATRVALHATLEEIGIWNQRRLSGPYLDDWNRILGRANACVSSCSAHQWNGNTGSGVWESSGPSPLPVPTRTQGDAVRDAGFVYMVYINSGDATLISSAANYLTAARTVLLNQAAISGTDFSNRTKWPANYDDDGFAQGGQLDYQIVNWLRRLTYAYSYIRPGLTDPQRTTLDAWFNEAGTFWTISMFNVLAYRMPNHLTDNLSCTGPSGVCPGTSRGLTHFGGDNFYPFHDGLNNLFAVHAALVGAIGTVTDNQTLKDNAKHWFRVWMRTATNSDGVVADQYRWNGSNVGTAFLYSGTVLGSMITLADHIARDGDTELMTYSAAGGIGGWEGGTKSLLTAMNHYANLVIKERNLSPGPGVANYGSNTATTNPSLLIGPGSSRAEDIYLIPANLYHKSSLVTQAYTRTLPTNPTSSGDDKWGGDWGTYPGIRFMFGQLENISDPYTTTGGGGGGPACATEGAVCINSDSDNAEETIASGDTRTGPLTIELEGPQLGGFRLINIPIPKNATIDTLTLAFTAAANPGSGTPSYTIKVQDSINAPTFVSGTANANISGRTLRAESVAWSPAAWTANTLDAASTTPDIKSLLQPLVEDAAWDPLNNSVAFVITNTVAGIRTVKPIGQGGLIQLTYTYTPAGSSTLTQTNYWFGLIDFTEGISLKRGPNLPATVTAGSCTRVHIQVEGEGGGFGPQLFKPQYAIDDAGLDGPFVDLTTDNTQNLYLGIDREYENGEATANLLSLDGDSFIPGSFISGPGVNFPTITFADDSRVEWVLSVCVKPGVALNTTFDLCMAQQDNTLVTCTARPRMTVGGASAYFQ